MDSLVHFEIHATDVEKLKAFYGELFGWKFEKYELPGMTYWGVITAEKDAPNAINGGLIKRHGAAPPVGAPVNGYACTMKVQDIEASIRKAAELGGVLALPKFAIPGMAWQAYFLDPDNNIFGLHQMDPNAK